MNAIRTGLVVLLSVLIYTAYVRAEAGAEPREKQDTTDADPREKLDTAIPEGIRLLEAKEYESFLKKFVPPDLLKRLTEKASLKEFARDFGKEKAEVLHKVLKEIKNKKPTLSSEGKEATYKLDREIEGKSSITFTKIGKYWYIHD